MVLCGKGCRSFQNAYGIPLGKLGGNRVHKRRDRRAEALDPTVEVRHPAYCSDGEETEV
jgi:hypothetical protein